MHARLLTSALAAAGILSAAGAALGAIPADDDAQPDENGPVVVGERRGVYKAFQLKRLSGGFDYLGEYRTQKQKNSDGTTLVDRATRNRETLTLSGEAAVGHENLLDLSGDVGLGLDGTRFDSDTVGQSTNDLAVLTLFDVRALVFGQSQLPVTAYAVRDQTVVNREFAGSIDSTTTEYGGIANLRLDTAPTTLHIYNLQQDQTDPFGSVDYHQNQSTAALDSNIKISDAQSLQIDYELDDVQETQGFSYHDSYIRNDGTFTHQVEFDPEDHDNLYSTLRVYDQTGLVDLSVLRLDERLNLYHTDTLASWYTGTLERQTHAGSEQQLAQGSANIRHKLYQSLVSTASVGASQLKIPGDFTANDAFVSGGLDYTKKVPLGELSAAATAQYNTENNSERGSAIHVSGESHTFNDPFPINLNGRNIDPNSIRVTNVNGFPIYSPGSDYTVNILPDRAELFRVIGGQIADGQTVLVEYDLGAEPASTIDTFTYTISLRYTVEEGWLAGLSPYLTYTQTDHSLNTSDPSRIVLDDFRSLIYGVDYQIGDFMFTAEQENHDSTVQPFDAQRLEASYNRRLGLRSSLNISASYNQVEYHAENTTIEFSRFQADWTQDLSDSFDLNLELRYTNENQSPGDSVQGFEEGLQVNWHLHQTSLFVSVRNATLFGDTTDTSSQSLALGLHRAF